MARVSNVVNGQVATITKKFWNDRVGFTKHIIGAVPNPNQAELLRALDREDFIVVKSGINTGKSAVEAWSILHYMCCRPECKILCTSPSKDQLFGVLWTELLIWHKRMNPIFRDMFVWTKTAFTHKEHQNWYAHARTATKENPQSLAGIHAKYVYRIVDEASAVFEDAFDVIEGATGTQETKELMCSNPTALAGSFYNAFNKNKDQYRCFTWNSLDHLQSKGGIVPDRIVERIRKKFGEDSNMWKVRVLGAFPESGGDSYIPFDWVYRAINREIMPQSGHPLVFGCDIARFGCFDDKTEILTDAGWKYFKDLNGNEKVLSLNGHTAVWSEIQKLHRYEFDGYLNLYEGESLNFCITDNHKLIVRSNRKSQEYAIKQLQDLPKEFVVKGTNAWDGSNPSEIKFISEFCMPNGGVRAREWTFDFMDWARFLGWYISEGSVFREGRKYGRYRVLIAQKKEENKSAIQDLLRKMGIKFRYKGLQFEFSNNEIGKHLVEHCCGRQSTRRVPEYIKNASVEIIEAFLETYALGDGSNNTSGNGRTYNSCSSLLIDDIQEMLIKIGRAGKKSLRNIKNTVFTIDGREIKRRHDTWCVYELGRPVDKWVKKDKIQKIRYKGFVYCVSVPNKIIMVRRRGSVMWSGNSDDTAIALRRGDEFLPYHVIKHKSTMEIAGYIAYLANREKPMAIFVDSIGIGSGVADRLDELGFPVIAVNVAESPAIDGRKYHRLRDELWGQARDWFELGRGKIWDNDDNDLLGQLTTPRYKILDSSGKIRIETKDEVKKRLGKDGMSPNIADAHLLTFAQPVSSYQSSVDEFWNEYYGDTDMELSYALDKEAGY